MAAMSLSRANSLGDPQDKRTAVSVECPNRKPDWRNDTANSYRATYHNPLYNSLDTTDKLNTGRYD